MGRPTKYNKTLLEKTKEYIKNYKEKGDLVPSIAGLACELKLNQDTIFTWAKDSSKEEFSEALSQLKTTQERVLLSGGLSGVMNAAITKLMLCNHGYSDKQQLEHSGGVEVSKVVRQIVKS